MIPLEEAQARLLALASPVPTERVPLSEAAGRWLAEPLIAQRTQPARDLSAMDGYAVRAGTEPEWRLVGESAAGQTFVGRLKADETVRIFTGAVIPDGADAVLIQENAAPIGSQIRQTDGKPPAIGDHIRKAGSDFQEGEELLSAGTRLNAAAVALAAMGGHAALVVRRKIRITLISTGDELVEPGQPARDDQIPASNGLMLAAMLSDWPVEITNPGIIPDSEGAIRTALRDARDSDVIVTIGGASVGDHDLVRPALLAEGAALDFWKVAMRPGKPVMVGQLGTAVALGLPGNPASAYVTAFLFLKPLIAALSGDYSPLPDRDSAILGADLIENGNRTDHIRAQMEGGLVRPTGFNDSAALRALARSNALIVRVPNAPPAKTGEMIDIIRTA